MKINLKKGLALRNLKGFTLIELLVVIAIIGILSSIVLASLNTARSRAKISAAKAELSSLRAEVEIIADGGSYANVCTSDAEDLFVSAADSVDITTTGTTPTTGSDCDSDTSTWAAAVNLDGPAASGTWFCVDYTGHAGETAAASTNPVPAATPFEC